MPATIRQSPHHARHRAGSQNRARRLDPVSQASCVVSSHRNCSKRQHQTQITQQNLNRHFDSNQQYSITAVSDGGGSVVERYAYSAYGQVTIADASGSVISNSAIANRYTYTGREWDETLGLFYFRARMYDPKAGRFCGRDPITYIDGENLYASYFYLRFTDPTGHLKLGMETAHYMGFGGGMGANFNFESEPCCNDQGKLIEDGAKSITIDIHAEGGIGVGSKWKAKVGGFELGYEFNLGKIAASVDISQTIKNQTCGEYDFVGGGCGSVKSTVEWSSSGSANLAFGSVIKKADLSVSAAIQADLTLDYCITPTGASYKSTLCAKAQFHASFDYEVDLGIAKYKGNPKDTQGPSDCFVLGQGSMSW